MNWQIQRRVGDKEAYWDAAEVHKQRGRRDKRERRTYSLGNSPSAKQQSKDVFPQAPGRHSATRRSKSGRTLAVADYDEFPANLQQRGK